MARVFSKVVVAGVGLIGGSFARALRRAGAASRIVGVGRSAASLQTALSLGVIDEVASDWALALAGADLLVLAAPVGQTEAILRAAAPHLEVQTVITDAGSTKRDVVAAFEAVLSASQLQQVVPAHPIAGAEKSGVEAASAALFDSRRVVMTPLSTSRPEAVAAVRAAWEACGAQVSEMSPAEHDAVFAAVSHLPHVLAYALVDDFCSRDNAAQLFDFAGGGFRDFTRIASSNPEMWRDICLANRDALLSEIDRFDAELARLRGLVATGDGAGLGALFARARDARDAWLAARAEGAKA